MKVDLSVIIVNFNTPKLVKECVKSVSTLGTESNFEIIAIDNASREPIGNRDLHLYDVSVIQNKINSGFAKAVNVGIKASRGKYILLLNSDTKVQKGAIDELYHFAKITPDAGVVGAKLLNTDGSTQESCFRFPTLWRTVKQYWLGQQGVLDKYAPSSQKTVEVEAVVGAAFLITPKAREKVGLLDERYFMFFEDLDYCRKIRKAGLKVYYLPTAHVFHFHGASGKKLADRANQWRRLVPSSKIYHGIIMHYLIFLVTWTSQKVSTIWNKKPLL